MICNQIQIKSMKSNMQRELLVVAKLHDF